jgi:peptidoglycan/xylan/chitin deacetylase (PgdA/CDA1 family)
LRVLSYYDINDPLLEDVFLNKFEYGTNYDKHTRVIVSENSYPSVDRPVVSDSFQKKFGVNGYYEDHPFVLNLTHDVDDIYPPFTHFMLSALRLNKDQSFVKILKWKLGLTNSPYKNLRDVANLEEKYGGKSTFFILPSEDDFRRKRYSIDEVRDDVNYLLDNHFEIGLHTSYFSFNNVDNIIRDRLLLEREFKIDVRGCRNHYLRFKVPDTWDILESAGFEYDTTYGLENDIGFRNGVCHPFYPYDLNKKVQKKIIELPLHIMDTALFEKMDLNFEAVWSRVKHVIDCVESDSGVATVLFHNSWFNSFMKKDITKLYEKILSYSKEKNAWITNSSSIIDWIKKVN